MMPPNVFDYIVAHEVAHLIERNHGPRFHALVDTLTVDAKAADKWIKKNGSALQRIG